MREGGTPIGSAAGIARPFLSPCGWGSGWNSENAVTPLFVEGKRADKRRKLSEVCYV